MRYLSIGLALLFVVGCATNSGDVAVRKTNGHKMAWFLEKTDKEVVVAVSPARQSMQMAGSIGLVLGSGVSAVVDAKYRGRVHEALTDYDAGAVLANQVQKALDARFPEALTRLNNLDSKKKQFKHLYKQGHDQLLQLKAVYGLYGPNAELLIKLTAELVDLPEDDAPEKEVIVCVSGPLLVSDSLRNPAKKLKPRVKTAKLTVNEERVEQWLEADAQRFRDAFEELSADAAAAMLTALDLENTARGNYTLVQKNIYEKEFEECEQLLNNALRLEPEYPDAQNGLAVVKFYQDQPEEALEILNALLEKAPEHGPAWFNKAWVLDQLEGDVEQIREAYQNAQQYGIRSHKKLDKKLEE